MGIIVGSKQDMFCGVARVAQRSTLLSARRTIFSAVGSAKSVFGGMRVGGVGAVTTSKTSARWQTQCRHFALKPHGGELVELVQSGNALEELRREAVKLPTLRLNPRH